MWGSTDRGLPGAAAHRWVRTWWRGEAGGAGVVADLALAPAEWTYRALVNCRASAYRHGVLASATAPLPTVSVGNLSVGGAGKTPLTRWIVERFLELGERPAVVHGGYGLDEPALHRRWFPDLPVIVARNRARGVARAAREGASVAVLDDAFQHLRLRRDLDVVLIAAEGWGRPRRLLPRGPWREAPAALERADLVVVTRRVASLDAARSVADEIKRAHPGLATVLFHLRPRGPERLSGTDRGGVRGPVYAMAGLARPDLFLANLSQLGIVVGEAEILPDHIALSPQRAATILRRAGSRPIVVTEKDLVKLEPLLDDESRDRIWVLGQDVIAEAGEPLLDARLRGLVA